MMQLWAGWYAAAQAAHLRGEADGPLLMVLGCKGGPDARVKVGAPAACCCTATGRGG